MSFPLCPLCPLWLNVFWGQKLSHKGHKEHKEEKDAKINVAMPFEYFVLHHLSARIGVIRGFSFV